VFIGNTARVSLYGPVEGYAPPRISLSTPLCQSLAYRTRPVTAFGTIRLGLRDYDFTRRAFLSYDSVWNSGDPNGFSAFGGRPSIYFDADGRCVQGWGGETASWIEEHIVDPLNQATDSQYNPVPGVTDLVAKISDGTSDLLRLGQGTSAAMDADNGWDVAIGLTQDVGRASGITVLVGGGLEGTIGRGGAAKATAPSEKFSNYIFKDGATHGKDAIFRGLGYSAEDSAQLAKLWEEQAAAKYAQGQYTLGKLDQYGQRINITIDVPGVGTAAGKTSSVTSGWMIRPDGSITLNTPFSGFPK
jgi:hypothetical protein